MKPLYIGLRNETQKNEQTFKQQKLQTRQPHQQKEYQTRADARRLPLVNTWLSEFTGILYTDLGLGLEDTRRECHRGHGKANKPLPGQSPRIK